MNRKIAAPWSNLPAKLNDKEICDPLNVISGFFSIDWLDGHVEKLEAWRYFVKHDKPYEDKVNGAGSLLFIYDLNLRLLESAYLLRHRVNDVSNGELISKDAKEIYNDVSEYLSYDEYSDPFNALKSVFSKHDLHYYKTELHEWLYAALYVRGGDDELTRKKIKKVFKNLLRLYAASWVIHEMAEHHDTIDNPAKITTLIDSNAYLPAQSNDEALVLNGITKLITSRFPEVRLIVHMGTRLKGTLYYLMVLIDDECKLIEHSVSNKIEDNCRHLADTLVLVHKEESAKKALQKGSRFWVDLLKDGNVLFQSPELVFPENAALSFDNFLGNAGDNWQRWGLQGKEFLTGADFYREANNYRLAAFLLHQAVESILTAVIQAVYGYRISVHNISKMLKITLLFTESLYSIFELDTEDGKLLFKLLQNAYTESRYKDKFNPHREDVELITRRVNTLYAVAEQLCCPVEVEMSSR